MKELTESQEVNQRYFWYIVNKKRNRSRTTSPIINDQGQMITDVAEIRKEWNNYYQNLYTATNNVERDGFHCHVMKQLEHVDKLPNAGNTLEDGSLEKDEVTQEMSKLKNRKAPGWDMITAEYLKHGGDIFKSTITWTLNVIIQREHVPQHFKRGLIVPIPKPDKDSCVKGNKRGITLLPVLYKILEKLIMQREAEWLQNSQVVDDVQGAGKIKCSSLHTSMLLQEVIAENRTKGETVYVALLDIKKAFDTVWIQGMLYKLLQLGLRMKPWRLIRDSYLNYECAAYIGGQAAPWFIAERGVHQGAPLSMPLYQVFINDLIQQLRNSSYAAQVGGMSIGSPSFADDISVVSLHKPGLNRMLAQCAEHSLKWRYEFSTEKCLAMIWGRDKWPELPIRLGNEEMQVVKEGRHMGITLTPGKRDHVYTERIGKGKAILMAACGIGNAQVPVPQTTLSKIYWNMCVPRMTYGLEVVPTSERQILELEQAHRQHAKIIQGVPNNIHRPAPLATLGWMTMAGYVALIKIMFLFRMLCLPEENLYRNLTLTVLMKCIRQGASHFRKLSPIADMYWYACKYKLEHIIETGMDTGWFGCVHDVKKRVKTVI